MPGRPLEAGIIGCGGISHWTMRGVKPGGDFIVTAAYDVVLETLHAFCDKYGIENRFERYEDLLEAGVDFVIINSPNNAHLEQAELAARRGIPCLVQKPLAPTLADAEKMLLAVEESGVKAGVTLYEFCDPLNHQFKAMVDSGFLGEPVLVQACFAHDYYLTAPPDKSNWRRDAARVGGGAFIQLAVHQVNLASWLLGSRVARVSAEGAKKHTLFDDETSSASAVFENGVVANFFASYATLGKSFTLRGTGGFIHRFDDTISVKGASDFSGEVFDYSASDNVKTIRLDEMKDKIEKLETKYEIHNRFARFVAGEEKFPCPLEMGVDDMRAVDAVYRSLESGRRIDLKES